MWLHNLYYNFIPKDEQAKAKAEAKQKQIDEFNRLDEVSRGEFNAILRKTVGKIYSDPRLIPFVKSGHLAPAEFIPGQKRDTKNYFWPDTCIIQYNFSDSPAGEFKEGRDYVVTLEPMGVPKNNHLANSFSYFDPNVREYKLFEVTLNAGRNDMCPVYRFYVDDRNKAIDDCVETTIGYLLKVLNATEA